MLILFIGALGVDNELLKLFGFGRGALEPGRDLKNLLINRDCPDTDAKAME
jgi:hypothetical protein